MVYRLWVFPMVLLAVTFLVFRTADLPAEEVGDLVIKRGVIEDDIYLAGSEVDLIATVNGDVVVAGGQLNLGGTIHGDVVAAGGLVILDSSVADDARLAGGNVQVRGSVDDDLIAAGGRIRLGPNAQVGGRAWISGGDIRVSGLVSEELHIAGGRVVLNGKVHGDVYIRAEKIKIGPNTEISGRLHTQGPGQAHIADGARVDGEVTHTPVEIPVGAVVTSIIGAGLVLLLSLMIAGVVLYLLFPRIATRTIRSLRETPWASLGVGLAVFASTPVIILALLVTVVGTWLALLLLAVYLITLLLGYLIGALFVGEAGLRLIGKEEPSSAWRMLALVASLMVLSIVGLIPLLGGLFVGLVLLVGMGALARQMYFTFRTEQA